MTQPWLKDRQFFVSPYNYAPAVLNGRTAQPGGSTTFYDSTIRKILLTPGLKIQVRDMLDIAAALEDVGIKHLTLNIHWWGEPEPVGPEWEVAQAIFKAGFTFTYTATLDNTLLPHWQRDLEQLRELGMLEPAFVLLPSALDARSGQRQRTFRRLEELIPFCRELGMRPAVTLIDVGRADFNDQLEVANLAIDAGATRLDLADSASSLSPDGMRYYIGRMMASVKAPIQLLVHVHDDFGLATAVAVAAITAGAVAEVGVSGISDRAGFPPLEEVAVVLESMYGISTGLKMEQLSALCALVGERTIQPPPYKAISGTQAFLLDLPYAADLALRRGRDIFPPPWGCLDPSWVGGKVGLYWLPSFLAEPIIALKLRSLGLPDDAETARAIKAELGRRMARLEQYPVWIEEPEVDAVCHQLAGQPGRGPTHPA